MNQKFHKSVSMSDRCNKTRKLSAKKVKHRRCYFKISNTNGGGIGARGGANDGSGECAANTKNQMSSSMQQFCIDSNIMVNAARKCSLSGKKQKKVKHVFSDIESAPKK